MQRLGIFCAAREKVFLFFICLGFQSSFFLQPVPIYQGEQPRMAVQPSRRHGCRIDGGPETAELPRQAVRKIRLKGPAMKNKKTFSLAAQNIPSRCILFFHPVLPFFIL